MELEQTRQKTCYDYCAYGPTYREGQQVLAFFPTVKKGETKKFTKFYKELYTIVETISDLNFWLVMMRQRILLRSPPREQSTRIRSVPKGFADYFV